MEQFTTSDGLSSNIISSVLQDSLGYIWMRTETGIAKYDGYEFTSYEYNPNDPNVPYQEVFVTNGLYQDLKGNIWLRYDGIGVSYYDQSLEQFIHFPPRKDSSQYIGNQYILTICPKNRDQVFVGTDNGLYLFDYKTNTFQKIESTADLDVKSLFIDNVGNLWIGTGRGLNAEDGEGLYLYEPQIEELHKIGTGNEKINEIHQDRKGRIWLATNRGIGRIRGYSPTVTSSSEIYYDLKQYHTGEQADRQRNNISKIFEADNGDLWFLASIGLAKIEANQPNDFSIKMYKENTPLDENGLAQVDGMVQDLQGTIWTLSSNKHLGLMKYNAIEDRFEINHERNNGILLEDGRIISIYLDKDNILWLGSERHGLLKLDLEQKKFGILQKVPGNPNSLGSNIVYTITSDDKNNIWFGTAKGLTSFNPQTKKLKRIDTENSPINGNVVFSSYIDSEGTFWLGHNPYQVSRLNMDTWTNSPFKYIFNGDTTEFRAFTISDITEDDEGNIWLASHGDIYKSVKGKRQFERFIFERDGRKMELTVNDIHLDDQRMLWACTAYGLFRLDEDDAIFREFEAFENGDPFREGVTTIKEFSSGYWLGTQAGGLIHLDAEQRKIKRYTTDHGLSGKSVNAILAENDTVLWLGTNQGLCRFDRSDETFINYSKHDGLPGNIININSAHRSADGTMYFGTTNGVVYFHPSGIKPNPQEAVPVLTELSLFNRKVDVGDSINGQVVLPESLNSIDEIILNHKNNIISFAFASMHLSSPYNNQYAYMLENLENSWNFVSADRRRASYTSLPAGEYIFKVRATNSDGRWSSKVASVKLTVLPPWWNTVWFRLILLAVLIVMVTLLYRLRIRNIKSRNLALEQLVEEKTAGLRAQNEEIKQMARQLHQADQSKIQFFMNISHEFRTPLTLILGPVANLLSSGKLSTSDKEEVNMIERNSHRLLRLTNQLLDATELEKGTLKLRVANGNVVQFVSEIVHAFDAVAGKMDIDYRFTTNLKAFDGWFDGDKIEKILYNLLSNAFKFTDPKGRVKVDLCIKNDSMTIAVSDTGIGISREKIKLIFDRFYQIQNSDRRRIGTGIGLNLAKNLARKHKGDLKVDSKVGSGTTFTLILPLSPDHYHEEERIQSLIPVEDRVAHIQKMFTSENDGDTELPAKSNEYYTVLLIEDSVDMRAFLKRGLKTSFSVLEAIDGEEGLALAREHLPDIIISDIMMPKMDGIELCVQIKSNESLSQIPVVLLTAKTGEEHQMQGYDVGADDYLTKPIDLQLLRSRILNLLTSREKLRKKFSLSSELLPAGMIENKSDEAFLQKAIEIVESNIANTELNYKHFVEALGVSKTGLYDRINRITGQSINLFIRTVRLKVAARLMEGSDMNFSEIAYKVGFTDLSYFSKCFKQQFGVSPRTYVSSDHQEHIADSNNFPD